jgi:NifU-like protein involved in Fe-S cluster formation
MQMYKIQQQLALRWGKLRARGRNACRKNKKTMLKNAKDLSSLFSATRRLHCAALSPAALEAKIQICYTLELQRQFVYIRP